MFIIRNDDVNFDTDINELKSFCEVCDKHGFKILQAITLIGECKKIHSKMNNDEIKKVSNRRFEENKRVVEFIKKRNDLIGVHGLWHTHSPTNVEIKEAKEKLVSLGFDPAYFIPPFNEGDYQETSEGLTVSKLSLKNGERLEDFIKTGTPASPIMYLHSWRFNNDWYTFEDLDKCLERLSTKIVKLSNLKDHPCRFWYNDWVKVNAIGKVLDVGKSKHWEYGFPTLDINPKLNPTYVANIKKTDFPDESFDTVLCNGMYELVESPQEMIDEAIRITKKGGTAIFGFVGKNFKPYLTNWKYFEGKEKLPPHERYNIDNEYHFLIVKRT